MNLVKTCVKILFCFLNFDCGLCFIPLIPLAVGGISAVIAGVGYISLCHFKECCTDEYIPADLNLLGRLFESELHDQHLAVDIVLRSLKDHIENENPRKALALSFQGASGTGKNHMVNLIVDSLYKEGADSDYVHYYNGHLLFSSGENVPRYKREIEEDTIKHLKTCQRSIFIFDEVDHIPEGTLDALVPFLDYNPRVLSVNPTQAIFIFVSNIGAESIDDIMLETWKAGKKREETMISDFEHLLASSALEQGGGLCKSNLINLNLIDHYIPFLPFEEQHVKKCIIDVFKKRDPDIEPTNEMIAEVMPHITFKDPPHSLFSQSGCKRVDSKVAAIMERQKYTNSRIKY